MCEEMSHAFHLINFRLKASARQLTSRLICHNLVLAQTILVRPRITGLKTAY